MGSLEEITQVKKEAGITLKREIGLISATNFVINIVIGSGIFVTPGKILAESGSVGMMLIVWIVTGIVAFLTCLPFGELSTVVPKSGSIYSYLLTGFGSYHPFFGPLPAFVYLWIMYVIIQPCNFAINAMLFADYCFVILQFFTKEAFLYHEVTVKYTLGALCLVVIGAINCTSVRVYVKSQDYLTYLKLGAIMFTIGCGVYMYASGKAIKFNPSFDGTNLTVGGITQALYFGLYAYDGGAAITNITEEIKRPEKNIMNSIAIGLAITTATYLLLNLAFLSALTTSEIASGTTVIADFSKRMFGSKGGVIAAAIICLCLVTSLMCGTFTTSRIGYVAAREGHMAKILSYIQRTQQTPIPAVVIQILLSLTYYFVGGDITLLIDMSSFFMWMSYGATMIALFLLRHKLPQAYRPYRVPSVIPVMIAMIYFGLVIVSLLITGIYLLTAFLACVLVILLIYYWFVYKAFRFDAIDKLQIQLQKLLDLVPPAADPSL